MAKSIRLEADPNDLRGLIYAMNRMEKAAQTELRQGVTRISEWAAAGVRGNYEADPYPRQAAVVARSVVARKDRMPYIEVGGRRAFASDGTPAGILMMGSEFGAIRTFKQGGKRFPFPSMRKARGFRGYWIFPALAMMQPEITKRWKRLVWVHIEKEWSRG